MGGVLGRLAREAVDCHHAKQKPEELERLLGLALLHVRPGEAIVELGCDAGGTLFCWRRLRPERFVLGVERGQGHGSSGRELVSWGAQVVRGDSQLARTRDRARDLLQGRQVGLLFIDADHRYTAVQRDYALWSPLVKPGGLVCFHDVLPHEAAVCEVDRVWAEVGQAGWVIATEPLTWGGIGVLLRG